jgi:hypothetical protein
MRSFFLFFFFSLLFLFPAFSQQKCVVSGYVFDHITKVPIPGAVVRELFTNKVVVTDSTGFYLFTLEKEKIHLRVTYVGYDPLEAIIPDPKNGVRRDFYMVQSTTIIDTVNITGIHKPDTVIGTQNFFIHDFEFLGDKLVLLTFEDKPEKSKVMLAGEDRKIISSFSIPVNALELYKDFLGYINVIGKDSVYRVIVEGEKIRLGSLPKDDFDNMIRPCMDTINGKIVFSDYREDYPEFTYYTFDRTDSTAEKIVNVVDEDLSKMYSFEYDFLPPKEKLYARKMELATGIDKREIAAYMTNFGRSRYFTPLYAPLFIIKDTLFLFNHLSDKLYTFNKEGKRLDSCAISYHHPVKWKEWRRRLIKEEQGDRLFALFLSDGIYKLKEIDRHNGKIISETKLSFPNVSRIRIKDGYVYYVYRPFESLQTKYLYKERIQ